ncbi:metal-dependent phosphohydrolase [Parasphaerochaeta coccoides]|uniref:Metal dependent phosphohydrolase n=1 Tax=Parasphaerochaeta coccoides (strain ATCC BAA-1237 / DSM 17374 / SPN1) TaxID=760011 RepID=F4GJF7_PARC1|nr:metal-dependent phosphohydrolase [Parasphaerochaeta coccoides]AEC02222.1 metal dependent phosphohydrolase [Parasphaerochaeta coccoides DSM 17374]
MSLNIDFTELENYVTTHLTSRRAVHSINCGRTMERIFKIFPGLVDDYGIQAAMCIGLMHDIAREWQTENLTAYVREHHISTEAEEDASPVLLHAPVGAHLSLGLIPDFPDTWATAIRWHTLGSVSMGRLGAALFIADYLEPLRTYITNKEREDFLSLPSLENIVLALILRDDAWHKAKGIVPAGVTSELREFLEQGGYFQ